MKRETKKCTLTIRVEPALLERFRLAAQAEGQSVNGQLVAYMHRAVTAYEARQRHFLCENGEGSNDTIVTRIDGMLKAGLLTESALATVIWVVKHQEMAAQLLGLSPCGEEGCAAIADSLRQEPLSGIAVLAVYKQKSWKRKTAKSTCFIFLVPIQVAAAAGIAKALACPRFPNWATLLIV